MKALGLLQQHEAFAAELSARIQEEFWLPDT